MPPWVQKVTKRRVSTVENEDGSYTMRYSYSRGKIHVGWSETTVKYFDKQHQNRTAVIWPNGTVYREILHDWFNWSVHQKVDSAIYEMAEALRGVDTRPKAVV